MYKIQSGYGSNFFSIDTTSNSLVVTSAIPAYNNSYNLVVCAFDMPSLITDRKFSCIEIVINSIAEDKKQAFPILSMPSKVLVTVFVKLYLLQQKCL